MSEGFMRFEMSEQPEVLARLVRRRHDIGGAVRERAPIDMRGTVFAARGSSRNAAMFGCHTLSIATATPSCIASLAVESTPAVAIDYANWLSISISQSGRTPEIVSSLERHRAWHADVCAVTNEPGSPLARAAEIVLDLDAGLERAVPATKTVTAQFLMMVIIASAFDPSLDHPDHTWTRFVDAVAACLDDRTSYAAVCRSFDGANRAVFAGRGLAESVASEGALKLKEITGITAESYDHLELLHGPIAVAGPDVPALVVDLKGAMSTDSATVIDALTERGATVHVVGDTDRADVAVAADLPEPLAAIVAVVRLQQIALGLSELRSIDADRPSSLSKVTMT